ncbi:hypothetical protein ACKI16_47685, partial [Streptomyces scabiei]|uniref:hypothetical protein n=1 Tax=Streptomyces scabiei TaxID=1930 RepID=UPI0038F7A8CF
MVEVSISDLAAPPEPAWVVVWLMAFPQGCCFYGPVAVFSIAGEESMQQSMQDAQPWQRVVIRLVVALVVIACGLGLRWY